MITVGMNYHVIPGMQKSFEDKFAGVIDALKQHRDTPVPRCGRT
jgi:hypothetical protein